MDLFLGQRACGLSTSSGGTPRWVFGVEPADAVQQLLLTSEGRRERRGRRITVWLSGTLARPALLQPVAGLRDLEEGRALALNVARDMSLGWPALDVWLSDALLRKPTVMVVTNRTLLATFLQAAKEAGMKISQICPWWQLAFAFTTRSGDAAQGFHVQDTDGITWLSTSSGVWTAADHRAARPQPSAASLSDLLEPDAEHQAWLNRRAFTAGLEAGNVVSLRMSAGVAKTHEPWPTVSKVASS